MTMALRALSSPEVTSSHNNSKGCVRSSFAMQARLRSPPETPRMPPGAAIMVLAHLSRRNLAITFSTRDKRSSSGKSARRRRLEKSKCSLTVSPKGNTSSWGTNATRLLSLTLHLEPLYRMVPLYVSEGSNLRPNVVSRVVLPDPDEPFHSPGVVVSSIQVPVLCIASRQRPREPPLTHQRNQFPRGQPPRNFAQNGPSRCGVGHLHILERHLHPIPLQ